MIEAVFEDPKVKAQVFAEIEPHLADGALLGSNTSTLPITELAEGVSRPADFIGLHFFSPVDKMPLLEIIKGEQTSDETLYRALDVAKQIEKTPIVVNDSRGFFTSRVIGTFINEGIAMLTEGVPAPTIEQASSQAGYPAPVLQLSDELNLKLMRKIRKAAQEARGRRRHGLGRAPVRAGHRRDARRVRPRPASSRARGFYEYEDGKRTGLWTGLREAFPPVDDPSAISLRDLEERMLFIEAIETVKCLDEGVIETVADANIGSIMGIGFPGWTGGVLQYINGYEGGLAGFVARAARARRALRRALRAAGLAGREGRARRAVPRRREGRRHRLTASSPELFGLRLNNSRARGGSVGACPAGGDCVPPRCPRRCSPGASRSAAFPASSPGSSPRCSASTGCWTACTGSAAGGWTTPGAASTGSRASAGGSPSRCAYLPEDTGPAATAKRTRLGVEPIAVASIVGTVDPHKAEAFDAEFRPPPYGRARWSQMCHAVADRRGAAADLRLPLRGPPLRPRRPPPRVGRPRARRDRHRRRRDRAPYRRTRPKLRITIRRVIAR